ncbi:hypothetical protein EYD10_02720 [Varanus komodoensis]|nr:hypothetical protein EYD10_02720 [Varanus komodoensis]
MFEPDGIAPSAELFSSPFFTEDTFPPPLWTDWFDHLVVLGTHRSLLQHHSSKASILWCSAFLMVQLSQPYIATGKTIALIIRTFVSRDAVASFKQALKLLTSTMRAPPSTFETAEIYFFMGQCYMEQICLLEACDAFTSAVRLCPRYADAYYQRGLCRMQLQQAKCILDFNKTLAVSPAHFQAYLSRAAYFGSKGRYSKAIMNCTEALKIEPKSVRAYLYRGALKFYNRTYKQAVEDLTTAIDLDNACVLAYYNRAISFHKLKDWKNGRFDRSLALKGFTDSIPDILRSRSRTVVFVRSWTSEYQQVYQTKELSDDYPSKYPSTAEERGLVRLP